MEYFKDHEVIKLAVLVGAFVIGVAICLFIVIKESAEMGRRRKEKQLAQQSQGGQPRPQQSGRKSAHA